MSTFDFNIKNEPGIQSMEDVKPNISKSKKRKPKQEKITDHMQVKKKRDRFKGMSEDEVMKRLLPDHLAEDLDIVIVGINPGLFAAYVGHHYAGPGNHFWKCMFLSGLIPEPLTAYDDYKLVKYGIGFTNIVSRTTRGSADLTRKEIKEGAKDLSEKLRKYKPKIAVFNGKGIYEVFCGHKKFIIGKQPEPLEGTETAVYVMPSSSARCSQLPRAVDKVPFYAALKKLRDYYRGDLKELDDSEVCFPDLELKVVKKEVKQEATEPDLAQTNDMQAAFNMIQSNEMMQHMQAGGPPQGNFMGIKQEIPFNPQDYGMSSGAYNPQMQGNNIAPNFSAVSTAAFSFNSSQPVAQGSMSSSVYPSQSQVSASQYQNIQPLNQGYQYASNMPQWQAQPQQVYIKSEPQEYGAMSNCPYTNSS